MKDDLICIAKKITGGRFILTVIAAVCLFMITLTACILLVLIRGQLKPEIVVGMCGVVTWVIREVCKWYFERTDRKDDAQ